jgi:DNA-binding ferritin-like protein
MGQFKDILIFFLLLNNQFRFRLKIFHWETENNHLHQTSDSLHSEVIEFEDKIAEILGGIDSPITQQEVTTIKSKTNQKPIFEDDFSDDFENAQNLTNIIDIYLDMVQEFYKVVPSGKGNESYAGLKAEFESYIAEINKLRYLSLQK